MREPAREGLLLLFQPVVNQDYAQRIQELTLRLRATQTDTNKRHVREYTNVSRLSSRELILPFCKGV
ncbi:hypothetical protein VZT92_000227 [Zoarces viviparus]|uniref:Uncharacterized protein n=1 Tax=Zoarces viviparus TaxID=48416 RepID=A0AAW1G501_ZOAVI